jgi:hypothetical protein
VNYDDEILMAYADGELDAAKRAEIAAAVEKDAILARRVEEFRTLRLQLTVAYRDVLDQPMPDRLLAAAKRGSPPAAAILAPSVKRGNVVQFPLRGTRAPGAPWRGREWFAMAASVLLGVALSWRLFSPAEPGVMVASNGALVARGSLAEALDQQLANKQRADDAVLIGLTFKTKDGGYCRNFTLRTTKTAGLACRVGADWQIPVTTSVTLAGGDMQQASGTTPPVVLQAIEARISGDPLDAAGEDSARQDHWGDKAPAP